MVKIYISPSTQANNIGVGDYGTEERRMNELAALVLDKLAEYTQIETLCGNGDMTLAEMVAQSNDWGADLHIALHSNACPAENAGQAKGTEIYYHSDSPYGATLAESVYSSMMRIAPWRGRGIKPHNGLYELNYSNAIAILIEVDFHDNAEAARWIIDNMDTIAYEIKCGIIAYCMYIGSVFLPIPKPEPEPAAPHWAQPILDRLEGRGVIKTPEVWAQLDAAPTNAQLLALTEAAITYLLGVIYPNSR